MAVEVGHLLPAHFSCCIVSRGHLCTQLHAHTGWLHMAGCIRLSFSRPVCSVSLPVNVTLMHGCHSALNTAE